MAYRFWHDRKFIRWARPGVLLALALVFSSCAPAAPPAPATSPAPQAAPAPAQPAAPSAPRAAGATPSAPSVPAAAPTPRPPAATPTPLADRPKYGGTLRGVIGDLTACWDRMQIAFGPASVAEGFIYSRLAENDYFDPQFVGGGIGPWEGTGKVRPDLAERWEAPSPTTWVFHLRKGVKYDARPPTSGREFTADDIVWAYSRGLKMPGAIKDVRRYITKIEALDKYTVRFTLSRPYSAFLTAYGGVAGAHDWMVYAKETEKDLCSWQGQRGTGAFRLTQYQPGVKLLYEKNPDYFGTDPRFSGNRLPYVDTMEMYVIPDPKTKVASFVSGRIDILSTSDLTAGIGRDDYLQMKDNPNLVFNQFFSNGPQVMMRTDKPPFNDIRLRRALSMSLDRDAMVKALAFGDGDPFRAVLAAGSPWRLTGKDMGAAAPWYEYNPQGAKKLLAEAGYSNGLDTQVVTNAGYRGRGWTNAAQVLSSYASQVGIRVKVVEMEFGAWNATAYTKGEYEGLNIIPGGNLDILRTLNVKGGFNQSHVDDPKMDAFMQTYLNTTDEKEQERISKEAQQYVADKMYWVQIPGQKDIEGWGKYVKGYDGKAPRTMFGEYMKYVWTAR